MSKSKYCNFCCNASVDSDLNHDNDLSYLPVGKSSYFHSMYIRSGNHRSTAIVVSRWSDELQMNVDVAVYAMKFCPECGRYLFENDSDDKRGAL